MHNQDVFLEQTLLEEGRVTTEQLEEARNYGIEHQVDLVDALISTEAINGRDIALAKAGICEAPFIDLDQYEACFANTQLVPRAVAERYCLFPLFKIDTVLTLAMDDPLNLEAMDQARQFAKCEVDSVLCDREQLRPLISRAYRLTQTHSTVQESEVVADGEPMNDNSQPVVAAVNQLLADAVDIMASDVHINPDEHELRLRYRVDGVLQEKQGPPLSMHAGIVQRLKVMAHLDLTQTRRPQDGKFRFHHGSAAIDVRMSTLPTVCGENVVLRLLTNAEVILNFHELGVPSKMSTELEELMDRPYGMILVTGPTGCGKTTTLYTVLNRLNEPSRNIMTIEDPVEIRLPYLRQIQVHSEIGLTFASALRAIVRQDPDVILVGEIRDNETATIALQAALTGHLVLATLHTNDAPGAVARLRDYNLPAFVINSAVLAVVAQRLVRRLCRHCVMPDSIDDILRHRFGLDEQDAKEFQRGKGCPQCGHTGYRGRLGLYELLKFSQPIQTLVEQGGSTKKIRERAIREGMRQMWEDGLEKARLGQTSLHEVAKVAAVMEVADVQRDELRKSA
ncbi:MAG: type II/IV secretion system protein [Planctomycetes bacterium]|nr:type II/IV secretion system protein [Planctomycetota bacterium]